jgi:hypothetical protein
VEQLIRGHAYDEYLVLAQKMSVTTNLKTELECHHVGEDGRITIEHWHERRRNLEDDHDTTNATPMGHDAHSPSSSGTGGGCAALDRTS